MKNTQTSCRETDCQRHKIKIRKQGNPQKMTSILLRNKGNQPICSYYQSFMSTLMTQDNYLAIHNAYLLLNICVLNSGNYFFVFIYKFVTLYCAVATLSHVHFLFEMTTSSLLKDKPFMSCNENVRPNILPNF